MRVVSMNGHIFDLDEVTSIDQRASSVYLTFKNGDNVDLAWRDASERVAICNALELTKEA
jgi:hypothetical protein